MTLSNQIIFSLRWRMLQSDYGVPIWRLIRWAVPRIAPYIPPRKSISPDQLMPSVKLEIRPSTIPNCGSGAFSLENIGSGVTIGEYSGDVVDSLFKWLRLRNTDYIALTENPAVCIDALAHPEMLLRYVNHHPDRTRMNIQIRTVGVQVFYETTRPVKKGEEFFTDYGDLYWRIRGITPRAD